MRKGITLFFLVPVVKEQVSQRKCTQGAVGAKTHVCVHVCTAVSGLALLL